jgi:peptide deformylase
MSIRKIVAARTPHPPAPAQPVTQAEVDTPAFQELVIDDLIETMHAANGAGLAAPQIAESVRLVAIHVNKNPRYPYKPPIPLTVLVNPVVTPLSDETFDNYEGCLSVPNLRGVVARYAHVRVTGWDRHGQPFEREAHGFTAGTFQHELDHLDATVFLDRVKDPRTLTTWAEFDAHHKAAFFERAEALVAKYGG